MYAEQFIQPTYMLLILPQSPVDHGGVSSGRAVGGAGAMCLSSPAREPGLALLVVIGLKREG